MKNYLLFAAFFCGTILLQSCAKDNGPKYVTLNENIKSDATYSLDVSTYGERGSLATITTQAANYKISQIDRDGSGRNIYRFSSDSKAALHEQVIIAVTEHDNRCGNNNENGGGNKTVVTINFNLQ